MIRTVHAGESFLSQSGGWIHFGLGQDVAIDHLVIYWPGANAEQIRGLDADRFYLIPQGSGQATPWSPPRNRATLIASTNELPADSDRARVVVPAGLPLPEIRMIDERGDEVPWIDPTNGPKLVNLWATWCGPCVQELSEWSQHSQQLRDAGLEVIAVNADRLDPSSGDPARATDLLAQIGFPFASMAVSEITVQSLNALQQSVLDRWKPLPVPSSFLVNARGEVVVVYQGPVDVEQLLADLYLLDASPEERRAASVPFPGRWVDPQASRASPRRVANQLLDQNHTDEAARYLERIVDRLADATDEDTRRELGDTLYFLGVLHDLRRQPEQARGPG